MSNSSNLVKAQRRSFSDKRFCSEVDWLEQLAKQLKHDTTRSLRDTSIGDLVSTTRRIMALHSLVCARGGIWRTPALVDNASKRKPSGTSH